MTSRETDYVLFVEEVVPRLRSLNDPVMDEVAEDLLEMSRSEQDKIYSHTTRLLQHRLKWDYQPEKRSKSWRKTVANSKFRISRSLAQSPSLRNYINDELENAHHDAVKLAMVDTGLPADKFPCTHPYETNIDDLMKWEPN